MNIAGRSSGFRFLPKLIGVALLVGSAFALGVLCSTGAAATRGDWLSFAGALLGAAITIAGSIAVLEWQRASEERERQQLLLDLLEDVDEACVPFQVANEPALKLQYGTTAAEQVRKVQAAIGRVHNFRAALAPKTARMMKVADELSSLDFSGDDLEADLRGIAFYPDSADFGGLNSMGHNVQGITSEARKILNGESRRSLKSIQRGVDARHKSE